MAVPMASAARCARLYAGEVISVPAQQAPRGGTVDRDPASAETARVDLDGKNGAEVVEQRGDRCEDEHPKV